jgi:hypothetical protein
MQNCGLLNGVDYASRCSAVVLIFTRRQCFIEVVSLPILKHLSHSHDNAVFKRNSEVGADSRIHN